MGSVGKHIIKTHRSKYGPQMAAAKTNDLCTQQYNYANIIDLKSRLGTLPWTRTRVRDSLVIGARYHTAIVHNCPLHHRTRLAVTELLQAWDRILTHESVT